VFRLIHAKYVLPLGWFIQVNEASVTPHLTNSSEFNPPRMYDTIASQTQTQTQTQIQFQIFATHGLICVCRDQWHRRSSSSARRSANWSATLRAPPSIWWPPRSAPPIHGPLLAIRYMIQDINFKALTDKKQIADWRTQLERLLTCLRKATDLVLPIVSAISPEGLTSAQTIPEVCF
jgi:hypothetical protein